MPKRSKGSLDIRDILEAVDHQPEAGWRRSVTTKGHPIVYPANPAFSPIPHSGTPGDQRAVRNFLSALRRAGFVYPVPRER